MATLVLAGLGSVVGGPIGQAIGALVGNQIDHAIFGPGPNEGPRLKELAITTSNYGQPLPRQFGRMRIGGSVIWATDIQENSANEGGGKGQPSTTTYSYSASFAVALSSTPLSRIGRIWADGNLLRGANEDLKVEGALRVYLGEGNGPVDPLIAADKGAHAPAFRDCAYVVFENLALADFGNRIPALTFEVFARDDDIVSLSQIVPDALQVTGLNSVPYARGFADEGGGTIRSLAAIDKVLPLACVTKADGVEVTPFDHVSAVVHQLPERLASADNGDGPDRHNQRIGALDTAPLAVRYYDEDRDYQPGVQRAVGLRPNGLENMVDLPATLTSSGARNLANDNAQRLRWRRERVTWRVGVLDHQVQPGSLAKIPGTPGTWRVMSWEWYDQGVEYELERVPPANDTSLASDPGTHLGPDDFPSPQTVLDFIELPPDGTTPFLSPILVAAASSETSVWRGGTLYAEHGANLTTIGAVSSSRAVMGHLIESIGASTGLLLEPKATLTIELVGDGLGFESTDIAGLANGLNRVLIDGEVVQFLSATPLSARTWQLTGLLRGRAGTEDAATEGHEVGAPIVLIDSRVTALDATNLAAQTAQTIAAAGRGDPDPVFATLRNPGLSRRPPCPVHARRQISGLGDWTLCWTRRARGAWLWSDGAEAPLVEEAERYLIGYGDTLAPFTSWVTTTPEISFSQPDRAALLSQFGPASLWVKQSGTFGSSPALHLAEISQV